MQHVIFILKTFIYSLWLSSVVTLANHSLTIIFGIVQFGIMAVLLNMVIVFFNAWDLIDFLDQE